ncbi:MAG: cyanophycin synthetase, partial [Acidimicrobiales bacterium]|nr:cyanophycin synthetase [Acidimicrobiales bacterium]
LVAAETLRALGWQQEAIVEGMGQVSPVKGRMEPVTVPDSDLAVIVDYSHKPEALKQALHSARELCNRRLWVVFGAGGDRDPSKRPLMGDIARQLADEIIVTSDNPRSEVPIAIAKEIVAGVASGETPYRVVLDRAEAIDTAITEAQPGDLVLIAGKGHETHQIIGEQTLPFDDAAVSRDALMKRRESNT